MSELHVLNIFVLQAVKLCSNSNFSPSGWTWGLKKKKDVCLTFSDRPTQNIGKQGLIFLIFLIFIYLFIYFLILNLVFFDKKCYNKMSEYIVTVPKRYSNQIHWNTTTSNTNLRLCMPKNAHTWIILHFFFIQITNPPSFQAKKANKPFYFFRPNVIPRSHIHINVTCMHIYLLVERGALNSALPNLCYKQSCHISPLFLKHFGIAGHFKN